jgi:hypothetical protein
LNFFACRFFLGQSVASCFFSLFLFVFDEVYGAVCSAQQAESEAASASELYSAESVSAATTLREAFDSKFSSAGMVSSSWLIRLLGDSYLRQGRLTCAYHTLYSAALAGTQWCLMRERSDVCTPNPMMPGMSKVSMIAAEGGLNTVTSSAQQSPFNTVFS